MSHEGVDGLERAALACLAEACHIAARHQLWPGFAPEGIPVALYRPGSRSLLHAHPAPPDGFAPIPSDTPDLPAAVCVGSAEGFDANTAIVLNGVATATVQLPEECSDPERLVCLILHEAFHAFQQESGVEPPMSPVRDYPEVIPANNALARAENEILAEVLDRTSASWGGDAAGAEMVGRGGSAGSGLTRRRAIRLASDFLALRAARQAGLDQALAEYERGREWLEGLAQYVELIACRAASHPAHEAAAAYRKAFGQHRFGSARATWKTAADRLRAANRAGRWAGYMRFYGTGAAMAVLLDVLQPGWKCSLGAGWQPLDVQLAGATAAAGQAASRGAPGTAVDTKKAALSDSAALSRLFSRHRLVQLLAEETVAGAVRTGASGERLQRLLTGPGTRIRLDLAENPPVAWVFDPSNIEQLGPNVRVHTRLLKVEFQGGFAEFTGIETVEHLGERWLQARLGGNVMVLIDGEPLAQESIVRQGRLRLTGPGLRVEAELAAVAWGAEGIRVRFKCPTLSTCAGE